MKYIVHNLSEKTIVINNPTDTIATLKLMVLHSDRHSLDEQRIVYNGNELNDELSLVDYEIEDSSTVRLVLCQRGAAKILTNGDIISDPLLAYPMIADEARSMAQLLNDDQSKVRNLKQAKDFFTLCY